MSEHIDPQTDPALDPAVTPDTAQAEAESSGDDLLNAATGEIEALRAEAAEMRDKWMRSEAEMQNLRARTKREVEDARQYAVQKFARDVVEAAENLKRGLASLPVAVEGEDSIITKMREGFESTERSFIGILERNGISASEPVGQPFDANLHQAMAEHHSDDHPQGVVAQSWTPAWTLHGRLLKPAMVVVSKGPASPAEGNTAEG